MANVEHSSLTDPELHDVKGVASATDNAILHASSGASTFLRGYRIPDLRLSQTVWSNTDQTTGGATEVVEFQLSHASNSSMFDLVTNYHFTAPANCNRVSFNANLLPGSTFTAGTIFAVIGTDSVATPLVKPFPKATVPIANKPLSLSSGPLTCAVGDLFYLQIQAAGSGEVIGSGSSFSATFWKD